MVESVFINSGRSCINCSGIWASRHTREIADAIAKRLATIRPLPPDHPDAALAAFTIPGAAASISASIDADLKAPGVTDVTAKYRDIDRVIPHGKADYLLPTVVHCASPEAAIAKKEYMFPFVAVVECPESTMLERDGPDARLHGDDRGLGVPASIARRGPHRPAQLRPGAHQPAQLAAAA